MVTSVRNTFVSYIKRRTGVWSAVGFQGSEMVLLDASIVGKRTHNIFLNLDLRTTKS